MSYIYICICMNKVAFNSSGAGRLTSDPGWILTGSMGHSHPFSFFELQLVLVFLIDCQRDHSFISTYCLRVNSHLDFIVWEGYRIIQTFNECNGLCCHLNASNNLQSTGILFY